MNSKKILTGIALSAAATAILLWIYRERKLRQKRNLVADAGFETAYDVYFPLKHNRLKGQIPRGYK